jgi:hypothetical protein
VSDREPETVCPTCGAAGWSECLTPSGRIRTTMHVARIRAERAVGEPGA